MANKKIVSALAASPHDEREKVVVDINGVPTDVFRPDGQSDEEWARVKEKAREDSAQTTIDNTPAQIERGDMTDEEWQKAKDLVGRKGDPAASGDYVFLKPQGEGKSAFVYPRKPSMTDEEWAAQVAEHKKHPRYGYTKSEKQGSEEEQSMRDRVVEKTVADPSNKELALSDYDRGVLERMNESDRRSFLEARMKNKGTPVSEKAATGTAKREGGGTMMGKFADAVKGLAGGATPAGSENPDVKNSRDAVVQPTQVFGQDAQSRANAFETADGRISTDEMNAKMANMTPLERVNYKGDIHSQEDSAAVSGAIQSADAELGKLRQGLTGMFTGDTDIMGSLGGAAGMVAGGAKDALGLSEPKSAWPNQADPLDPQAQPPVPLPQQPGMPPSGSVSASGNMPSGFKVAQADPEGMKRFREAADNAKAAGDTFRGESQAQIEHQRSLIEQTSQNVALEQAEATKLSRLAGEAKLTSARENQRFQQAAVATRERARMAAANPIDPNRYWNSKSEGQRASGLVAAALFGFTGQGLQWLGQVDAAIANDMRAQESDRSSLVNAYGEEAKGLGEAGRAALEDGATVAEAHILERQTRLAGIQAQLDMLGKNLTQSDQIMRYQQMSAELNNSYVRNEMQGAQLAQTQADSINENRYKNASLAQQSWAAQMKADAKQQKGEPLPPAIAKRLDESFEAYRSVSSMAKLAKNAGAGDRFKRDLKETAIGRVFDGNEEGAKNDLYEQQKVELMKRRAGGALQRHEVDILEPITGGARSGIIDSYPTLERTAKDFRSSLVQTIRSEAAANRDVSKYVQMLSDMDAENDPAPLKSERPAK